ncbi:MAG: hypothetical protein GX096_00815 [Clostridiales bacterium]|nr:hypothetical protein [Clostridiales bacterium]
MKTSEDFKRALGAPDDAFTTRIDQTLLTLQNEQEEIKVKKVNTGLVIALAIILIATVAIAAVSQWGVIDYLTNSFNTNPDIIENAAKFLQTDIKQEATTIEQATIHVRETVFDGKSLYIAVAVKSTDDMGFLLGTDSMPSDPVSDLGQLFKGNTLSMREQANEAGTPNLYHVSANDMNHNVNSIDFFMEEDGTLVFILMGEVEEFKNELAINLECNVIPYTADGKYDHDKKETASVNFTMTTQSQQGGYISTNTADYTDCGVRIDSIAIRKSEMSLYYDLTYTVIDEAAYAATDDGLWFEMLDKAGERIDNISSAGGGTILVEGSSPEQYIANGTLPLNLNVQESLTIRGYNCWEKNRYEAHDFDLKEVE